MKRNHNYKTETLETYYALGKGNVFLKAFDVQERDVLLCKEPKDAYTFIKYEKAKHFLTEYAEILNDFKIYSIHDVVKTKTLYTVLDCDIYKDEQKGPKIMGKNVQCGKFDMDGNRI